MNTREIALKYRLAHWSRVIHERRESGLCIRAFCRQSGFHENMYYYWQRKLREVACHQTTEPYPPARQTDLPEPCFAEVRLESVSVLSAQPAKTASGRLCVEFSGMQINADSDYPPEKLAVLLRELAQSC